MMDFFRYRLACSQADLQSGTGCAINPDVAFRRMLLFSLAVDSSQLQRSTIQTVVFHPGSLSASEDGVQS